MRFFILLSFFIYSIVSSAQVLDRDIVVNNVDKVTSDHAFLDGDLLSFKIKPDSKENYNLDWELCIELQDNRFAPLMKESVTNDSFYFTITPSLFKQNDLIYRRIESSKDSSIYYHAVIFLYNKSVVVDSMSIFVNVLPSIPKIIRSNLEGTFNYEQCCYNDQAKLTVSFTSHSMDECFLVRIQSTKDSLFLNTFPEDYTLVYIPINFADNDSGYSIQYNEADWGQYYKIMSLNKYGSVFSMDTIHTTELINDSNVISAIEHFNQSTNIKSLNYDAVYHIISYKNNNIYINTNSGFGIPIKIFSPEGHLVLSATISNCIDISFLPKGLYYVKALLTTGKYVSCKIIKK